MCVCSCTRVLFGQRFDCRRMKARAHRESRQERGAGRCQRVKHKPHAAARSLPERHVTHMQKRMNTVVTETEKTRLLLRGCVQISSFLYCMCVCETHCDFCVILWGKIAEWVKHADDKSGYSSCSHSIVLDAESLAGFLTPNEKKLICV